MTWIKICGITNLEDAFTALEADANALGFVFYEKSPRNVHPEIVRRIVEQLPRTVEKVGVFVHHDSGRAVEIARHCGLTALQIQIQPRSEPRPEPTGPLVAVAAGSRTKTYLALPAAWLLIDSPVTVNLASLMTPMSEQPFEAVFLDSSTPELAGGTGKTFDWEKVAPLVEEMSKSLKIVVAGGLTPSNVAAAIRILKPWGVDVSSGVEDSPGKKDPEKVRAFIRAVRQTEKN
jgi:phosphoribosylanthranilate isomerase